MKTSICSLPTACHSPPPPPKRGSHTTQVCSEKRSARSNIPARRCWTSTVVWRSGLRERRPCTHHPWSAQGGPHSSLPRGSHTTQTPSAKRSGALFPQNAPESPQFCVGLVSKVRYPLSEDEVTNPKLAARIAAATIVFRGALATTVHVPVSQCGSLFCPISPNAVHFLLSNCGVLFYLTSPNAVHFSVSPLQMQSIFF